MDRIEWLIGCWWPRTNAPIDPAWRMFAGCDRCEREKKRVQGNCSRGRKIAYRRYCWGNWGDKSRSRDQTILSQHQSKPANMDTSKSWAFISIVLFWTKLIPNISHQSKMTTRAGVITRPWRANVATVRELPESDADNGYRWLLNEYQWSLED